MNYVINEATIQDIQVKYYPDIDINIISKLNSISPDYNESQPNRKTTYLPWLIKQYKSSDFFKSSIISNYDPYLTLIKKYLIRFEQLKNELPENERDINKYDIDGLRHFYDSKSKYLTQKEKKNVIKSETKTVYDSPEWMIVIPSSFNASKFWGLNTKWCTTYGYDRSYYDKYSEQGPLYINIDKRNNKKWQFHFETNSFYTENDMPIIAIISSECSNKSISEYCNMPEDVLQWYKENRPNSYNRLIEKPPKTYEIDRLYNNDKISLYMLKNMEVSIDSDDGDWGWFEDCDLWMLDKKSGDRKKIIRGFSNSATCTNYKNGFCIDDEYYYVFFEENGDGYKMSKIINGYDYCFKGNDYFVYYGDGRSANDEWPNDIISLSLKDNRVKIYNFNDRERITYSDALNDNNILINFKDKTSIILNLDNGEIKENKVNEAKTSFWKTLNKINEINRRNCDDRID